jgi:hypothetical protein
LKLFSNITEIISITRSEENRKTYRTFINNMEMMNGIIRGRKNRNNATVKSYKVFAKRKSDGRTFEERINSCSYSATFILPTKTDERKSSGKTKIIGYCSRRSEMNLP